MPATSPSFMERLKRIAPYFAGTGPGFALVIIGAAIAAMTEPALPALLKPLLDSGFKAGKLQLWLVPVAIIGLFLVRGIGGFAAQYGLSWSANRAILAMRGAMFERLLFAEPALF